MANGYEYKLEKGKDFAIEIEVTVSAERYHEFEETVYDRLSAEVKLPGFRNGKAPRAQIEAKIGTTLVTETMKDMLPVIASEVIDEEKLSPITTLEYDVTKVQPDGSVVFKINFTNYPDVKLGDLSKLKVEAPKVEVTDADVQEVLQRLFKPQEHKHDHEHHDHDHDHEHDHDHTHEAEEPEEITPVVVTDEMAKELGIADIQNAADLDKTVRSQLQTMKQNEAEQGYENNLMAEAIKLSDIPLPDSLIDQQTAYLVDDYVGRIEQLGVDIEGFLQAQNMTMDKVREQKREQAKQKISQELVMNEIVKKYELTPEVEEIEKEIESISDPEIRHSYDNYQGRRYILSVLVQRRAMEKLRDLASKK